MCDCRDMDDGVIGFGSGKEGGYGGSVGAMIITNVITKRYDMSHEIWSTILWYYAIDLCS